MVEKSAALRQKYLSKWHCKLFSSSKTLISYTALVIFSTYHGLSKRSEKMKNILVLFHLSYTPYWGGTNNALWKSSFQILKDTTWREREKGTKIKCGTIYDNLFHKKHSIHNFYMSVR